MNHIEQSVNFYLFYSKLFKMLTKLVNFPKTAKIANKKNLWIVFMTWSKKIELLINFSRSRELYMWHGRFEVWKKCLVPAFEAVEQSYSSQNVTVFPSLSLCVFFSKTIIDTFTCRSLLLNTNFFLLKLLFFVLTSQRSRMEHEKLYNVCSKHQQWQ